MGIVACINLDAPAVFPPPGWVTNRQAAERLGVGLNTLTCVGWKFRAMLRGAGRRVRLYPRGITCIYPVEVIERIAAAQIEGMRVAIPDGFVDKDGACAFFGVTRFVWKTWVQQGKVRCGRTIAASTGARRTIYAIADLERMREVLFGEDKLYKTAENEWHVPVGFLRREEAWETLGVGIGTWERWEREGTITCGVRVPGGPKLYKIEDIHRLLDEYGKWCPPYADPDRPGVMRVPLSGRDIKRREALIDAADVGLIEGGSCTWSPSDYGGFVSFTRGPIKGMPLRRMIMGIEDGKQNVRHVNGDALDCRRENLVVRTIKQRARNARKIKAINGRAPTSRFKGVHWETQTKAWRAKIQANGKSINLGRFGDEIAAAGAYDEAARLFFGEHARVNFPDGMDAWIDRLAATAEPLEPARWRNTALDIAA
jgi:hypothetical protein